MEKNVIFKYDDEHGHQRISNVLETLRLSY